MVPKLMIALVVAALLLASLGGSALAIPPDPCDTSGIPTASSGG